MARDGSVLVKFLADTLGFRRGTEDMSDALDKAARDTEKDTKAMADAFRRAGDKIHTETKDIGKETKVSMKDAGKETGAEFIANMGEGIGSGAPNLQDTILGTIGGIAPALGAAGVGVAIGATAVLGIVQGINAQNQKVKEAAMSLFEQMRNGIVDASGKEDLLQRALGVDNMYDAIAKAREEARKLGVPVKDVLSYLDSAGRVITPQLKDALDKAAASANKQLAPGTKQISGNMYSALGAANDLQRQAGFTGQAWKDAADAAAPFTQQMKDAAHYAQLAQLRGAALVSFAEQQYKAGNPLYAAPPYKTGKR